MLSSKTAEVERCQFVAEGLRDLGYRPTDAAGARAATWRLAPQPLTLSGAEVEWLYALGENLHAFNRALDNLYIESAAGRQPNWIARYLDQGKPESLVRYA